MFDSLKTEWKEFIIDKEKTITEDESLFSLTDNEKRLFQKIKEIKSLINISYEEDYLDFIKRGTGPKSKINYYSYPGIDDETNIKNYSDHEVVKVKNNSKIYFLIDKTVDDLANGQAIGWFQGRMEFGPRGLGGRSILGDPRSTKMQKDLKMP